MLHSIGGSSWPKLPSAKDWQLCGPSPPLHCCRSTKHQLHLAPFLPCPQRREAMGLDPEGGDPDLEGLPDDVQLEEEEPAELRAARDRLAAFTAARQAEAEEAPPGALGRRRAVLGSACVQGCTCMAAK